MTWARRSRSASALDGSAVQTTVPNKTRTGSGHGEHVAVAGLADLGIDHAMVCPSQPWDEPALDTTAAMVPDIHALVAPAV